MSSSALTKRSMRLLRLLHEKSKSATVYTIPVKQDELAKELGISRQALNVHLRKLRNEGYIRTGRGFIDITERGLNALGISANPVFIFVKISPTNRSEAYRKIKETQVRRIFRVAGDMDIVIVTESEKLNETLQKLATIKGVQETKSYITIESLK